MQDEKKPQGIVIPPDRLSNEVLEQMVEEFILREGTDYGAVEVGLPRKKEQVNSALKSGHVLIFFNPDLETTTLMRKEEFIKLDRQNLDIVD